MKILVIGFNQNQCIRQYYLRQQLQVVPPHYSLVNYFLLLGHEMHHRTVTLGEDLSQYDEVIVCKCSRTKVSLIRDVSPSLQSIGALSLQRDIAETDPHL